MTKFAALLCLTIILAAPVAFAQTDNGNQPMPDSMLQKDYDNCMDGTTPAKDPQRGEYCECIRQGMRGWTVDQYGAVASEQAKAANAQSVPAQITDLAQACIKKVLH